MLKGPELVGRAAYVAHTAHEGQKRKYTGDAYFVHCTEVALMIASFTEYPEPEKSNMVAAAFLHDVIEDTKETEETLRAQFPHVVVNMVVDLTDQYTADRYPDFNRRRRKELELNRLALTNRKVQTIKLADLISNTSSIVKHDPGFAKVYLAEKSRLIVALDCAELWAINWAERTVREAMEKLQ